MEGYYSRPRTNTPLITSLQDWILQLPNVTKAAHTFGGTEFQVQGLEFVHTHGTSHLDIRLSSEDQERILKEGKAEPPLWSSSRMGHFQNPFRRRCRRRERVDS